MPRPLEVELLVCPDCRHVGKIPGQQGLKGYCVGSVKKGTAHKKARMVPVRFKEVAVRAEKAGQR